MASTPARRPASVTYALTRALKAVHTGPEHAPTVALAKRYAQLLDDEPDRLARLGRPFLAVLVELRMTPKSRASVLGGEFLSDPEPGDVVPATGEGGGGSDSTVDPVDELRRQRDKRGSRAN